MSEFHPTPLPPLTISLGLTSPQLINMSKIQNFLSTNGGKVRLQKKVTSEVFVAEASDVKEFGLVAGTSYEVAVVLAPFKSIKGTIFSPGEYWIKIAKES